MQKKYSGQRKKAKIEPPDLRTVRTAISTLAPEP
jgi:hypothetical protein